jgi:Zn-dependent protease
MFSYIGVILLHELGHMHVAQRLGCRVRGIYLYPIHGICEFEMPWSRYDQCLIAWGGVAFQAIAFIPCIAWIIVMGYTPYDALNAPLAIFGGFSAVIAAFNLFPAPGLDGASAWAVIPEYFRRRKLTLRAAADPQKS